MKKEAWTPKNCTLLNLFALSGGRRTIPPAVEECRIIYTQYRAAELSPTRSRTQLSPLRIKYTENLSEEANQKMNAGHEKYEREHGIEINYKKFAYLLEDEKGETFGVLSAYTAYTEIYIDDLWVDENYRRQGYGKQLLQAVEDQFQGRGYNNINLVTSEFNAPEFYKKCGYEVEFIRVHKTNPKLTKTFFIKYLQ
jgi:ribosomal protein S18 acetylase RimI-like enzyme